MLFVCVSVLVCQRLTCSASKFGWLLKTWSKSSILVLKRQEVQALCNTAEDQTWGELNVTKLRNVYNILIIKDEGGDCYIKTDQGNIFKAPSLDAEELDREEDEKEKRCWRKT